MSHSSAPTDIFSSMNDATRPPIRAAVRPGHVVRLNDVTGDALDQLVDQVAPDLPVILDYRGPDDRSAHAVASEVLDALELILIALFPSWLPGGAPGQLWDVSDAQSAARELCSSSRLSPAVTVELARSAAAGTRPRRHPAAELRATGLVDLLRHAYGRPDVVLAIRASGDLSADAQHAAVTACEWLAYHGRLTVWLTDDALPAVERVPVLRLRSTAADIQQDATASQTAITEPAHTETTPPVLSVSRPTGAPAPHSAAEQALEASLSRQRWAQDRRWNRAPDDLDPLTPSIIVDLMWTAERIVVEVDGADHRRPGKYARDRARDNMLQRHGYLVLRYTNEQVLADADLVAAELREMIEARHTDDDHPTGSREHQWTTRS
ncbi:DUF559 domain-containing protein [Gordonia sp. NB41Y]|nr:DUF559 domain-containing protein [Gordonia sp. NB41Y]WLP89723.1 DUF559 domain-containing protein [Gordonia sp. NB41Y]